MKSQVTPAQIVVALILLLVVLGVIWYFTMGKPKATEAEDELEPVPPEPEPPEMGGGAQGAIVLPSPYA